MAGGGTPVGEGPSMLSCAAMAEAATVPQSWPEPVPTVTDTDLLRGRLLAGSLGMSESLPEESCC